MFQTKIKVGLRRSQFCCCSRHTVWQCMTESLIYKCFTVIFQEIELRNWVLTVKFAVKEQQLTVNSNFPHHWLLTTHGDPTSTSLCKSHLATSWYLRFTSCQVLCHKVTKPLNCSDECTDLWLTALRKRKEKKSKENF